MLSIILNNNKSELFIFVLVSEIKKSFWFYKKRNLTKIVSEVFNDVKN